MKKKILPIASAVLFFILFVIFTLIVKKHSLDHFDFNTTVRLQNHIPRRFDGLFSLLSLIGSVEVLGVVLIIFLIIRKKLQGIILLALFAGGHLVEIVGKAFLHHPGPPFLFFRYNLGLLFPSAYVQPGS